MQTPKHCFVVVALILAGSFGCSSKPKNLSDASKLEALISRYTEASKRLDLFYASYFDLENDLGEFGDYLDPAQKLRWRKIVESAWSELATIDAGRLTAKDQMALQLFRSDLDKSRRELEFPMEFFSVSQMSNRLREYLDESSPTLTRFPFSKPEHFRAFVQKAHGFQPFIERQIAVLEAGAKQGYALNCTIAKKVVETYKDGLLEPVERNPFYRPALKLPEAFSAEQQMKIRAEFQTMVATNILPGFKRFNAYYTNTYLPKCRSTFGVGRLPRGRALYEFLIFRSTDLESANAKTLHATGLREVARIKGEIQKVMHDLGYNGSFSSFLKKMAIDPKNFFGSSQEMFDVYAKFRGEAEKKIAVDFDRKPKTDFKIVEGENPEDAAASYLDPSDFTPFGRFMVNAKNLKATPRYGTGTLFLHEAVPGHHFHSALQYEMKDTLSEYQRKLFFSTAFSEGWALYAERWGREAGLVDDPYQMFGSLSDEMLRAVRLVVDTGMHAYDWPRAKVIRYMQSMLATDAREIESETDRYSVWPGQALAYKTGQLKILELRERAKQALGSRFRLSDFHGVVLGSGTVTLPILESNVLAWIETKNSKKN